MDCEINTQDLISEVRIEEEKSEHKSGKEDTWMETETKPLLHYIADKAGMESVDKEKIQQKIIDASKNSSYYKKEVTRAEKIKNKAKVWRKYIEQRKQNKDYWRQISKELNNKILNHRKTRDLSRTWIHVDMDMFYAAVFLLDNPSYADKPIAVGDSSMISTANYVARQFGVRSAMPGFIGKKLCPELTFVNLDFERYKEISVLFKDVLSHYDIDQESMGLDESNMDITDYLIRNDLNTPEGRDQVASEIRQKVKEATKINCSAGVAWNKMLAKICSDLNKPDGHYILPNDSEKIEEFMFNMDVRKIPGIGRMGQSELNELGIFNWKHIIDNITEIYTVLSERSTSFYMKSALGIARNIHEIILENAHQKSISVSETFKTITNIGEFHDKLEMLSEKLEKRLLKNGLMGKSLCIKLKDKEFDNKDKSMILPDHTNNKFEIFKFACKRLESLWPHPPVRLLGIRLSNLIRENEAKRR